MNKCRSCQSDLNPHYRCLYTYTAVGEQEAHTFDELTCREPVCMKCDADKPSLAITVIFDKNIKRETRMCQHHNNKIRQAFVNLCVENMDDDLLEEIVEQKKKRKIE